MAAFHQRKKICSAQQSSKPDPDLARTKTADSSLAAAAANIYLSEVAVPIFTRRTQCES